MKTSEDVLESGMYSNDCCNQELVFDEGSTFWRCPRCQNLCGWELDYTISRHAEMVPAAA